MKRILPLILILSLLLTFSVVSFAMPDNPAGSTVIEVPQGEVMENNYGHIQANYGTINNNYGVIDENYGIVNSNEGTIVNNSGTVYPVSVSSAPEATSYTYNAFPMPLVTSGSAQYGTMQYAVGNDSTNAPDDGWSDTIPTGVNAGTYYVWYRALSLDNQTTSDSECVTSVIKPKQLVVYGVTVADKKYDGTNYATVYIEALGDLQGSDTLSMISGTGTFASCNAGTDIAVLVSFEIEGECASNYIAPVDMNLSADITKRTISLKSADATKDYDELPLTCDNVAESGDGFVLDEGIAGFDVTGSQTEVGSSDNYFTYTLRENTIGDNYEISVDYGTLTVNEPPATEVPTEAPTEAPETGDADFAVILISIVALGAAIIVFAKSRKESV